MRTLLCFTFTLLSLSCFGAAIPASTSTRVIYASQMGAKLDSDVWAGGGTDDSAALQAGLNLSVNYKAYEFVVEGPALISTNLVINSNTKLRFLSGAGLFMAAHKSCWLIGNAQNTNYASTNIVIEGGILNANGNSQNEYINNGFRLSGQPGVDGVWFSGVDNIIIRDTMIVNAKAYTFHFTDSRNISVFNCTSYFTNGVAATNTFYGNDGVHFNGNIANVKVRDFWAHQNDDDVFALMTDETDQTLPVNDPRWTINSGSMSNIVIENVFLDACKNVGKVQSYGSTNAYAKFVTLRNIHGSSTHQGLLVLPFSGDIPMDNFTLDGFDVEFSSNLDPLAQPALGLPGVKSDSIILSNIRINDKHGAGMGTLALIQIGTSATNIIMNNVWLDGSAGSVASQDTALAMIAGLTATNQPTVSINNLTARSLFGIIDKDNSGASSSIGVYKFSNLQYDPGTILNVGGFTNIMNGNEPKFISTNWVSGKLYTNVSGALQYVQCPVSVTTAAINGSARVEFVVGTGTTPLFTNAIFGGQTTGSSLAVTNLGTLTGYVLPSQMFYFSNSLVGAGDAARTLPNGQQVTY